MKVGDEVQGKVVLATLSEKAYKRAEADAEEALATAKKSHFEDVTEKLDAVLKARENLKACTIYNTDFMLTTSHGEDALRGEVLEIVASPATHVDVGATVMLIKPHDTFFIFNKMLAILSFIGAFVSLIFHRIASR